MANEYGDRARLKRMRRMEHSEDDQDLTFLLEVASRRIDQRCDRVFYAAVEATAREFELAGRVVWERKKPGQLVMCDDFHSLDELTVELGDGFDYDQVDTNGYRADPLTRDPGWPYTGLRRRRSWWTWAGFPSHIRITAKWGWAEVPPAINEATLLLASRLYLRKDSPEGTVGSAEWGLTNLRRLDPDVEDLIEPYLNEAPGGES